MEMSYYNELGLIKEPFSTSPDPTFFYRSSEHNTALHRLEIAVRLRRGLSLILGDIGTGKTTLSRAFLQSFDNEDNYVFKLILDPTYKSEFQFLSSLTKMFGVKPTFRSTLDYKEAIEKYLFKKGVDENKTIVLLIDEGQKLNHSFLEILRTLLNYETNEFKLLQLIVLAQMELLPRIKRIKNFYDRITLKYIINPLDEIETEEMIKFRLSQSGLSPNKELFTPEALKLIYEHTLGYPRRISVISHNALEHIVMNDKKMVNGSIINKLISKEVI
ncbi:AAA family ATPase [Omnitrophica bacterium]|nr:AAA family ATPase [Candidatus Omnitrophota bacterium]